MYKLLYNNAIYEELLNYGLNAVGCIFYAKDSGKICLVYRSQRVRKPHCWSSVGGKVEDGEELEEALRREVSEELQYDEKYKLDKICEYKENSFKYTTYLAIVDHEFTPILNWENEDFIWINPFGKFPRPLHPGFEKTIQLIRDYIANL